MNKPSSDGSFPSMVSRLFSNPWWASLLAVGQLVLGVILLGFPVFLGELVIWLGGYLLIIAGLLSLLQAFRYSDGKCWNFFAALFYLLLGGWLVSAPLVAMSVWTLIVGILLLIAGVVRLVIALSMRGRAGSVWRFMNASVSIILGAMVTCQWPESSLWFLGTLIAVELIFSGWATLCFALVPQTKKNS